MFYFNPKPKFMKKITLFFLFAFVVNTIIAQTVISQSVDPVSVTEGGAACWSSPSNNGTGDYRQNTFYRRYDLANDFGITGSFEVGAVQFGQASAVEGTSVTVTIYIADSFPGGTLIPLASEDYTLSSGENILVEVPFNVTIPANSLVVFELLVPESANGEDSFRFFPGFNSAGQNDPSYLQAVDCNISTPTNTDSVVPGDHYLMNLVEAQEMSVDASRLKESISLYPNPVNNVLNISLKNGIQVEDAVIYDLLGNKINVSLNNNVIDTSLLNSGVYMLQINTNEGTLTKKIIKR